MKTIAFALSAGFLLILGTVAVTGAHQGSVNPDVIHGCFKNGNGAVFIVDATEECSGSQTAIDWNAEGPTGPTGATGPAGNDGIGGADGVDGAPGMDGAQGPQGIPGPVGLPGIIHVQTFGWDSPCGDNGGPPTLVQGWSQDYDFTLTQDSKVFITGHATGKLIGSGEVQVRTLINGVSSEPNNTCFTANDPGDPISLPVSVVVDLPAGTHTIDFESVTWHRDASASLRHTSTTIHVFILETQ